MTNIRDSKQANHEASQSVPRPTRDIGSAPTLLDSPLATRTLMVGTRGSALAQWQTDFVVDALRSLAPDLRIERRIIKTAGDKDQTRPLAEIGGLGVFTKEIENALLAHEIDIAVHSLKDLPTEMAIGLTIAAITEREDPRDCLVSRHNLGLMQLPAGARVGTSSARRMAQLLAARPDLHVVPLRGNVDTRLRKAKGEEYDAVVIAAAGLIRLGRANEITEFLPLEAVLPDPGQGALAVQIRADDDALAALISRLDHAPSHATATAERAFLQALGGGCRMPIGAYATIGTKHSPGTNGSPHIKPIPVVAGSQKTGANASPLQLHGMVASLDGKVIVRGELTGDTAHPNELGMQLANQLLREGGADILGMDLARRSIPMCQPGTLPNPEAETRAKSEVNASPLRGRRILITRAREQATALADKVRALGGEPVQVPAIEFAPLEDFAALDAALGRAAEFDWIVFTSTNGVRAIAERLHSLKLKPGIFKGAKLAAIGPSTAGALRQWGLNVDFVPTKFLGEQIAIELPVEAGQCALLLRADIAPDTLARGLAARGANVTNVEAYRTIMPPSHDPKLGRADAVTFTSSSTVRNFVAMLDRNGRDMLNGLAVFCIGPVTAETARELGVHVDAVAGEHTIDGLVGAIDEYYRGIDGSSQGSGVRG